MLDFCKYLTHYLSPPVYFFILIYINGVSKLQRYN